MKKHDIIKYVAKKARNISKGTIVSIPARKTAKLVLSKELKNRMNSDEK